nr:uncharacterized protein LOC118877746 isoform X2 [Drosophila suzukii]
MCPSGGAGGDPLENTSGKEHTLPHVSSQGNGATSNTISDLFIGESLDSTTTSYLPLEEKTCWREREEKKSPPAKRPLSDQSDC